MKSRNNEPEAVVPFRGVEQSRREWLIGQGTALGGLAMLPWESLLGADSMTPFNRFPRMVQEWHVQHLRAFDRAHRERIFALQSRADAEQYVHTVREKIRRSFGPFPEKTPLNAQVTRKIERPDYTVENIIFESRPQFYVTGNLYLPTRRKGKLPGVIGVCGHSATGKAVDAYQSFAQSLGRLGYACFIIDPIGQGERLQFPDEHLKSTVGVGVREHLMAGNQQSLVGEFLGAWRAWDGIRALDYLLTRPEVDPKQVGVTGNSGGGTMTTWLCGLEERWSMAAPSCFVTSFRRNLENELPADTEQCPPNALALGLDHMDFLAAMAPKPVIILAKERDYFDVRGGQEALARLRHLYRLLGAEDQIQMFVGPTEHGYSIENREAMYRWFNRVTGVSDATTEPTLTLEKEADLACAPKGQVATLKSRTLPEFTAELAKEWKERRGQPQGDDLRRRVQQVLRVPMDSSEPLNFRILRPGKGRNYPAPRYLQYLVETEPGIQAVVTRLYENSHVSRPPATEGPALLYVSDLSADAELRGEAWLRERIQKAFPGQAVYAMDVRGSGDSQPDTCNPDSFHSPYGSDYFYAVHGLMMGRPYVGQKTLDVLHVLEWLRSLGHRELQVVAQGRGALPAVFAVVLAGLRGRVVLRQALTSYEAIASQPVTQWPVSCFAPGVLREFDLPDCYSWIRQQGSLEMIEPKGA